MRHDICKQPVITLDSSNGLDSSYTWVALGVNSYNNNVISYCYVTQKFSLSAQRSNPFAFQLLNKFCICGGVAIDSFYIW